MAVFSSASLRRVASGALFLALLTACVLLWRCARAVADNANCKIYCVGQTCFVQPNAMNQNGNCYEVLNDQVMNQWWNATTGCLPPNPPNPGCQLSNTVVPLVGRQATCNDPIVCSVSGNPPLTKSYWGTANCGALMGAPVPLNGRAGCTQVGGS